MPRVSFLSFVFCQFLLPSLTIVGTFAQEEMKASELYPDRALGEAEKPSVEQFWPFDTIFYTGKAKIDIHNEGSCSHSLISDDCLKYAFKPKEYNYKTSVGSGAEFIILYKAWVAPLKPHTCRFSPSCSEYALQAVNKYGLIRGLIVATARIARCHPFAPFEYDPLP